MAAIHGGSLLFRRLDNNTPIDQPANVYMTVGKYIFLEEVFAKMRKICEDGGENIESSAGIEWLVYFRNGPQGFDNPIKPIYVYLNNKKTQRSIWPYLWSRRLTHLISAVMKAFTKGETNGNLLCRNKSETNKYEKAYKK